MSIWDTIKATLRETEQKAVELLDKMKPDQPERTWDKNLPYTPKDEDTNIMLRSCVLIYSDTDQYMYIAHPTDGICLGQDVTEGDTLGLNLTAPEASTLSLLDYWVSHEVPLMIYSKPGGETVFMEEEDNTSWIALDTNL